MRLTEVMSLFPNNMTPAIDPQARQQRIQLRKDLEQVGQDLQAGNLSAAQSDLATVQQDSAYSSAITHGNFSQAINQLSQDLQAGNLSGAQQDFATLQSNFPALAPHGTSRVNPPAPDAGGSSSGSAHDSASQLWSELGQAIQTSNLTMAQQAYAALAQEIQQFALGAAQTASQRAAMLPSIASLSVSA
jgi:outer membrane protein assembly factor BamD (BamD/ComL family)